jgi:hypothetical protein
MKRLAPCSLTLDRRKFLSAIAISFLVGYVGPAEARFARGSTASTSPIPFNGNLVARFDAAAPGATVSSWTDSVNRMVAGTTVGTAPVYAANVLNGLPSVHRKPDAREPDQQHGPC